MLVRFMICNGIEAHNGGDAVLDKRLSEAPTVPADCRQCPIRHLTVCRPLQGERLEIVQSFKNGDRILPAGSQLYRPGAPCPELYNLLDGWVSLYRVVESGRCQILGFALPGSFLGFQPELHGPMLHGAECITDVAVCVFPRRPFPSLIEKHPDLAVRLVWLKARDTVVAHDNLTNIGSRQARARVAHLLLELYLRLNGGQLKSSNQEIEIPLTQIHLADALGLTSVYINITLRQLRERGLLSFKRRRLEILDPVGLAELAEYEGETVRQEVISSWDRTLVEG